MPVTPVKRKSMKGGERKGVVRSLWLAAGAVSFGLGTAGTVLPLLPTVPFYMVTLFCLARGSERFHRKFLNSSLYRKTVGAYEKDKSLTLRAKTAILLSVSAVMGTGGLFFPSHTAGRRGDSRCLDSACDSAGMYRKNKKDGSRLSRRIRKGVMNKCWGRHRKVSPPNIYHRT